ncbi:MAG: DUF6249 domain-containing protein [Bacteroidales bacterium]
MDTATIIGLIIAFVVVFGGFGVAIWLILLKNIGRKEERLANIEARNKERLALIEKGMDPNLADRRPEGASSDRSLLIGWIIVCAVIGRIIAFMWGFNPNGNNGAFIFVLPAFFAGIGFLVFHFYQKGIFFRKNK